MKIMDKILKCIDKDDQVTMDATDEQLTITLCKNKKQTKMKISLVDVDIESFQVPANIEFDTISRLQSGFFSQQINKMKQLGEHTIEFKTNEEYLFLKSTGDLVETEISVQAGKETAPESIKNGVKPCELVFLKPGTCSHEYSLGSIKQFMKPASWIPEMEISMKKDFPILFNYDIENISLKYYLAPKIED
jgi:proliferating cell nuclear antigen PCNA